MTDISQSQEPIDDRPVKAAIKRGLACKCPACGQGRMFRAYLKVADTCPNCGEALYHHRADDGPAYLTILIVGHILAPVLLFAYAHWKPEPWMMAVGLSIGCILLSLALLPRMKGMVVAIQWSQRMHGFGRTETGQA
jgi:uncharacterized protein (DUF983 family)